MDRAVGYRPAAKHAARSSSRTISGRSLRGAVGKLQIVRGGELLGPRVTRSSSSRQSYAILRWYNLPRSVPPRTHLSPHAETPCLRRPLAQCREPRPLGRISGYRGRELVNCGTSGLDRHAASFPVRLDFRR